MSVSKIPNPSYIKMYMEDGTTTLETFDEYLHTGVAGKIFHAYSAKFTEKLSKYGIITFKDLTEAVEKVNNKTANYPRSIRDIILGHHAYYMKELKASEAIWDTLSPENLEEAKKHDYLVMKDPEESEQDNSPNESINETQN